MPIASYLPPEGTYVDDNGRYFVYGASYRVSEEEAEALRKVGVYEGFYNPTIGKQDQHFIPSFKIEKDKAKSAKEVHEADEGDGSEIEPAQPPPVKNATGSLTTDELKKGKDTEFRRSATPPNP